MLRIPSRFPSRPSSHSFSRCVLSVVLALCCGSAMLHAQAGSAADRPGPTVTVGPQGSRDTTFTGTQFNLWKFRNVNGGVVNLFQTDSWTPTWNRGTQAGGFPFDTVAHKTLELVSIGHSSAIEQPLTVTAIHTGTGDNVGFAYVYDNHMLGGAVAGSDEGHVVLRAGSYPLRAFESRLNGNPENAPGSTHLHWSNPGNCGGSGSAFGSDTCIGAGYWLGDYDRPIHAELYMNSFKHSTSNSPTVVHVTASLTPDVIVSSQANIPPCPDAKLAEGCAITVPVTLPRGFRDPGTAHACISSQLEHTAEEVAYTLGDSAAAPTITLTGQRFIHWNEPGGTLTIALRSCALVYFAQDAADNNASFTNGGGPTWYTYLGAVDAHNVLLANHVGGKRFDGSIGQQSILPDGGKLGLFGVYPGALVIDLNDPQLATYNGNGPGNAYGTNFRYAHVGTNTVPWKAGDRIALGYNAGDIDYFTRFICDNGLADAGVGKDCNYMEVRGNPNFVNHYRSTYDPAIRARRHVPTINFFEFYSNNNSAGAYKDYNRATGTPDQAWLNADHAGCGGHLDDPQNCPDHFLLNEGGRTRITVHAADGSLEFNMPVRFDRGVSHPLRPDPASSNTACTQGDAFDSTAYHYVCTAPNHLRRTALADF